MEGTRVSRPYRVTPVFDEHSLPAGLRRDHRTKAGVWGVVRVIEGEIIFTRLNPPDEQTLSPGRSGLILPDQPHFVAPAGPMRMQIEFYDHLPLLGS